LKDISYKGTLQCIVTKIWSEQGLKKCAIGGNLPFFDGGSSPYPVQHFSRIYSQRNNLW